MLPRVQEMIQYVEGDPEKELLITHRKAKGIRTGLAVNYFRNYLEIVSKLIYLIFIEVG